MGGSVGAYVWMWERGGVRMGSRSMVARRCVGDVGGRLSRMKWECGGMAASSTCKVLNAAIGCVAGPHMRPYRPAVPPGIQVHQDAQVHEEVRKRRRLGLL